MKVLILTHGTRGDVQPFAALARALEDAGHQTVLAAPASFRSLAAGHGLRFAPLDDGPNRLADDPELRAAIETNYRGMRGKLLAVQALRRSKPLMLRTLEDMAAVARDGAAGADADVVVHHPGIPGHHVAERLGVPAVPAALQPGWVPTSAFPNQIVPLPRLPKALNRATHLAARPLLRTMTAAPERWRSHTLGLQRRRGRHDILRRPDGRPATVLQAFSRHLLPQPPDWPAWVHTTGYWFLPAPSDWTPPAALADFLAAGPPPVYVGFGSMAGRDPQRVGRTVGEAVRRAGVRAVLVTGWGGIDPASLPDDVLVLDQAPHDWLFPQVAAIVHHGGGGTTGAALAAGRPQVVCPFVADQPFWARRVHEAGVTPTPLPQRLLDAERLAAAIGQAVSEARMAEAARRLGELVRAENGAATAVEVLERVHAGTDLTSAQSY